MMSKFSFPLLVLLMIASAIQTDLLWSQTQYNAPQSTTNFKFSTWNTEWLTCTANGPTDEELQVNNVVAVIKAMNSDIVALQEIGTSSTYTTLDTIVRRLGNEWDGRLVAWSNNNCSQNQGIVYKKSKVQLVNASLITNGGSSYDWSGGRYPALYNVNLLVDGNAIPVSVINIHAKAMSDETSYNRRKNASAGLKALLDGSTYNANRIVLLGDFNDYLTGTQCSTCSPGDSPYLNFMSDSQNYQCLTNGLYDPNYSTPVIDNIIISNELTENYKTNSVSREEAATQTIFNYRNTTSDHTPVSASFSMTVGAPSCEAMTYAETFATSLGEFTPYSVDGSQVWIWRTGYGATVSGYNTGVNYTNEDWLISPAFNLTDRSSATIAFSHALNYCASPTDIINNQTLWVSTNYTAGTPANASWTQLSIPTMPSGSSWAFLGSGDIPIPAEMLQSNVHFAFKYLSGTAVAGTWEIKNFSLNAECSTVNASTPKNESRCKIYALGKRIIIRSAQDETAVVCDATGRVLFSTPFAQDIEIPVYHLGIYLVRVGNTVTKVMVK